MALQTEALPGYGDCLVAACVGRADSPLRLRYVHDERYATTGGLAELSVRWGGPVTGSSGESRLRSPAQTLMRHRPPGFARRHR